ncbi:MAG: response regulator [Bdellovibrionia bacterium]
MHGKIVSVFKTILVVDDEEFIRRAVALLLSSEGFIAVKSKSGNEALAKLRRAHVDLIVSDIDMEDGSGFDLLRGIRNLEHKPPLIFLTGNMGVSKEQAEASGGFGIIQKPFVNSELISMIRKALG